ncbi:MAG: ABC transporter substrate-binding protein, partial [Myxococcales bacterium]|nr:ABC transporter substrate-binding protein [Myxococcales bacterium]
MEADPDRPGRPRPLGAPPSQLSRLPRRAFLAAALVAGCSRRPSARPGAERVISLSPSTTEAIFAIGAGARLVGRSEHCDYPGAALALPSVGGYASPDLERVIALRPDLVVGEQSPVGPALAERLAEQGIATLFPPTRSLGEIIAMLHLFGQRFAAADGAERITRRIEGQVARVT